VRNTDFSGDAIDQLILDHLLASDVSTAMLGGTARIGSQARLLGACRRAKEQLSTATIGTIAGASGDGAQLSRAEFEQLLSAPLDRFLTSVDESLRRNGIPNTRLGAVAIAGGGANIPLLRARLSQRFGVPVHSAAQPALVAALGAAVLGPQYGSGVAPTAAAAAVETPTEMVGTAGLDMTQAAWAAQATDVDDALAWSQDADHDEPVPYTGRDATGEYANEAREFDDATGSRYAPVQGRLPWYKRTALVLSVAGAGAAVLLALILAINLLLTKSPAVTPTSPPPSPAPSQTVTITGPDDSTTVTVIPAPPPPSTEAPPPATTATTPAPAPSTTTEAPPTTTTAPPTTTSQATTTAAPTTTRVRPLPPIVIQPPFGH
jgi:cell division ATPase FtsA